MGGVAYAMVLMAAYLATLGVMSGRSSTDAEQLERCQQQTAQLRLEHQKLMPELSEMQKKVAAALAVSAQPDWSILFDALAAVLGEAAVLQEVELLPLEESSGGAAATVTVASGAGGGGGVTGGRYVLRLRGLGKTQQAVAGFVLALERLGVFESVRLMQTAQQVYQETEAVSFRAECVLSGEGAGR